LMISTVVGLILFTTFGGIIFKKLFSGNLVFNIFKSFMTYILGYSIFFVVTGILGVIVGLAYAMISGLGS
ncbi:MAG: hypothetical protein AAF705_18880, partial [Bacteroidota bacterium]